jgi:hypothetical protein
MHNIYKHNYKLLIDRDLPIDKLLLLVEKRIKGFKFELCVILSADKQIVLSKTGEIGDIEFPEILNNEINIHNAYFTHNHPNKGFFSLKDIKFAHSHDLKQIRAVAGNKVYVLEQPKKGWRLVDCNMYAEDILSELIKIYNEACTNIILEEGVSDEDISEKIKKAIEGKEQKDGLRILQK